MKNATITVLICNDDSAKTYDNDKQVDLLLPNVPHLWEHNHNDKLPKKDMKIIENIIKKNISRGYAVIVSDHITWHSEENGPIIEAQVLVP